MTTPPTVEVLLRPAVETLLAGEQVLAVFLLGFDEEILMVPCVELAPHEVAELLPHVVEQSTSGRLRWVSFCSDSYLWRGTGGQEQEQDPAGNLHTMFEAGHPQVTEALTGMCVCPDGPTYSVELPYLRDCGVIDWGTRRVTQDKPMGRIADGIYAALRGQ